MSEQTFLGDDFLPTDRKYYALISGGKDSMTLAHYLESKNLLAGCVFLDTGICARDTRAFIESIDYYSVEIVPTPERYEWFVWKYGFPRYGSHGWVKDQLKGRAIRQLKQKHKEEEIYLASGTRRFESGRRKFMARPVSEWEGLPVYAPLYNWTTPDVWRYVYAKDILLSPVYKAHRISFDCFCGAMAPPEERSIVKRFFPEEDEQICKLECRYGGSWGNAKPPTDEELAQTPLVCEAECIIGESK